MKQQQMKTKNTFKIPYENGLKVTFDSDFDSGNCSKVLQRSPNNYDIFVQNDSGNFDEDNTSKSWFYFSVEGFKQYSTVRFNIHRVHMLQNLYNVEAEHKYRPVFKINDGPFQRLETAVNLIERDSHDLVLGFQFDFDAYGITQEQQLLQISEPKKYKPDHKIYFAFSYPYEYQKNLDFINEISLNYQENENIYFHSDILCKSQQERDIHIITISSKDEIQEEKEENIDENLFPVEKDFQQRCQKFSSKKPIVFISGRVHPGETPASFAVEGLIRFLLDEKDLRSDLARKFFVFKIVTMINPDGVFNGHYRKDCLNQNLNRFYLNPTFEKQPSIYSIIKLLDYYQVDRQILMYMDFHAHCGNKGHFVYGNACNEYYEQTENVIFSKIISQNCPNFEQDYCCFSKKQMKTRDRFEEMTKQGAGRVVAYTRYNILHAYTFELGFHQVHGNAIKIPSATNIDIKINDLEYTEYPIESVQNNNENKFFTPSSFYICGKAIICSLLDNFDKNPFTRLLNSTYKSIENMRKETAWEIARTEKFRKEPNSFKKAREIEDLSYQMFFQKFEKNKVFSFDNFNYEFPIQINQRMKKYTFKMNNNNEAPKKTQSRYAMNNSDNTNNRYSLQYNSNYKSSQQKRKTINNGNGNSNNNTINYSKDTNNDTFQRLCQPKYYKKFQGNPSISNIQQYKVTNNINVNIQCQGDLNPQTQYQNYNLTENQDIKEQFLVDDKQKPAYLQQNLENQDSQYQQKYIENVREINKQKLLKSKLGISVNSHEKSQKFQNKMRHISRQSDSNLQYDNNNSTLNQQKQLQNQFQQDQASQSQQQTQQQFYDSQNQNDDHNFVSSKISQQSIFYQENNLPMYKFQKLQQNQQKQYIKNLLDQQSKNSNQLTYYQKQLQDYFSNYLKNQNQIQKNQIIYQSLKGNQAPNSYLNLLNQQSQSTFQQLQQHQQQQQQNQVKSQQQLQQQYLIQQNQMQQYKQQQQKQKSMSGSNQQIYKNKQLNINENSIDNQIKQNIQFMNQKNNIVIQKRYQEQQSIQQKQNQQIQQLNLMNNNINNDNLKFQNNSTSKEDKQNQQSNDIIDQTFKQQYEQLNYLNKNLQNQTQNNIDKYFEQDKQTITPKSINLKIQKENSSQSQIFQKSNQKVQGKDSQKIKIVKEKIIQQQQNESDLQKQYKLMKTSKQRYQVSQSNLNSKKIVPSNRKQNSQQQMYRETKNNNQQDILKFPELGSNNNKRHMTPNYPFPNSQLNQQ